MPDTQPPDFQSAPRPARNGGFTLLEMMAAIMVVGLLAAIAIPSYVAVIERQKIGQAKRELSEIAMAIERYRTLQFKVPESLDDLGPNASPLTDPWGRGYLYLNFSSSGPGVMAKIRKDHNLHPLNTEFDLYSLGKDGDSKAPLTAKASHDDVIWARDGDFIGLAEDF
jgi:general secretion pathway protein G